MKTGFFVMAAGLGLAACTTPPKPSLDPTIQGALDQTAAEKKKQPGAEALNQALLPPIRMGMPSVGNRPIDPKFDLSVNNAPAAQVFMSIVSGTRYNMLVHPDVSGTVTLNLKDVSIQEALEAIRELYGYDYRIDGTRIYIQPIAIQTRVFNVNYLIGQRLGRSDVRVTSGSIADAPSAGLPGAPGVTPTIGSAAIPLPGQPGAPGSTSGTTPGTIGLLSDSSRIQTQSKADFWDDLERTLRAVVGPEAGRSVVVNPQAGVVVVRAMPRELRQVENYLKAIRQSVERQVVLEAKIIEVTLNNQYQSGVNWAAFPTSGISVGPASPGTFLGRSGNGPVATGASLIAPDPVTGNLTVSNPALGAAVGQSLINFAAPGASLFGIAFQTRNFAALMSFLETQGAVQVLSSPRIATLNNQKAVLKVGIDQFFLTSIAGSTTTSTTTTNIAGQTVPSFPTITLRPFFSGVALDVTPQIDEDSNIILHVHPSVSDVQTDQRQVNLGTFGGQITLPLAKSNVSETDSVVKAGDGNIVAIGGLMKVDVEDTRSGLPGIQDAPVIGSLFRSTTKTYVKKELVILIKPTVLQPEAESGEELRWARERIMNMLPASADSGAKK